MNANIFLYFVFIFFFHWMQICTYKIIYFHLSFCLCLYIRKSNPVIERGWICECERALSVFFGCHSFVQKSFLVKTTSYCFISSCVCNAARQNKHALQISSIHNSHILLVLLKIYPATASQKHSPLTNSNFINEQPFLIHILFIPIHTYIHTLTYDM